MKIIEHLLYLLSIVSVVLGIFRYVIGDEDGAITAFLSAACFLNGASIEGLRVYLKEESRP